MKAAILRRGAMVVDEWPDPEPGPGQVLVRVVACGICGSDLHMVGHTHELVEAAKVARLSTFDFDPDADVVMGHEIAVEVLETGAGVDGVEPGSMHAAMPRLTTPTGIAVPGYDNVHAGGYAERMLLDPGSLVAVPNGLDPAFAALTEPMAVGLHAVQSSSIAPGRAAIVIGCGPVGLAVVAALKVSGVAPIIAADYSPTRRAKAAQLGADVVLDAAVADPFDTWRETIPRADRVDHPPVVFEAVGVPKMIDRIMAGAPDSTEIIVVGVCMADDEFRPMLGTFKRLTLKFVLGWTPSQFRESLENLAQGRIDPTLLVTGMVDLNGVPDAFAALADPEQHVKILVRPST